MSKDDEETVRVKTENGSFKVSTYVLLWIVGVVFIAGGSYVTFASKQYVTDKDDAVKTEIKQLVKEEHDERLSDMKEIRANQEQIILLLGGKMDKREAAFIHPQTKGEN